MVLCRTDDAERVRERRREKGLKRSQKGVKKKKSTKTN